jgi:hypothetical protein
MATTEFRCGCIQIGNAYSFSRCREGHDSKNLPGNKPAVDPTSIKARKAEEAKESGRKLKPGRHRWNPESGETELIVGTGD